MYVVICLFVSLELSSAANMNSHDDPTNFLVRGLALALVEFISKMFLLLFYGESWDSLLLISDTVWELSLYVGKANYISDWG